MTLRIGAVAWLLISVIPTVIHPQFVKADTQNDYGEFIHPIASLPLPVDDAMGIALRGDTAFIADETGLQVVAPIPQHRR